MLSYGIMVYLLYLRGVHVQELVLASFLYVMFVIHTGEYNSLHTRHTRHTAYDSRPDMYHKYSLWRACTMSRSIACFIFGFSLAPCHVRRLT